MNIIRTNGKCTNCGRTKHLAVVTSGNQSVSICQDCWIVASNVIRNTNENRLFIITDEHKIIEVENER